MGLGKLQAFLMGVFGGAVSGQGATTGQALVKQANGSWAPGTVSGGSAAQFVATSDGSASAPAFRGTDADTGIYFSTNVVRVAINGFNITDFGPDNVYVRGNILRGYTSEVNAITADVQPGPTQSHGYWNNTGATGAINISLPDPSGLSGIKLSVVITAAQYVRFTAFTGHTIRDGGTASATAGYIRSNVIGSSLTLLAITPTEWVVVAKTGTWTVDS